MPEVLILILVGLAAGVLSGVIGVGGGTIIVPALIFFVGMSQHQAQGTSLAMMIPPIGILAVVHYWKNDYVNFKVAGILVCGFVVGALVGSRIAVSLPEGTLKKIFGVIMVLIALKLILSK